MEEEADPYSGTNVNESRSDTFGEDYVKVPESVNVPEASSSPEMIGLDDVQNDEQELHGSGKDDDEEEHIRNLGPEDDDSELHHETPSAYVGAIEDVIPKIPSPITSDGSPSRPSTKTVETPRATGYLSFLNGIHPVVLYLIYWSDPKLTLLSLVLTLVVLVTLYVNTFLHTVTLLLLAAMVVSLLYIVTKIAIDSFYNRAIVNPFSKYLEKDLSIPEEQVTEMARFIARKLNCHLNFLVKVVFFANTLQSLKFMVALFLVSYVTNCFDILTSLFLGVMVAYTVPYIYNRYQGSIDNHINNAVFKLTHTYSRVVEKIPFLPKLKSD